jgi:hypothetical protein
MEPQTRFDLTQAIAQWRKGISARPEVSAEDIRELESHLTEGFAGFREMGLTSEDAFWLARRKLGPGDRISAEFHKLDPERVWRQRAFWMVLGIAVSSLWGQVSGLVAYLVMIMAVSKVGPEYLTYASTVTNVATSGLFAVAIVVLSRGSLLAALADRFKPRFPLLLGLWLVLQSGPLAAVAFYTFVDFRGLPRPYWPSLISWAAGVMVATTIIYSLMPARRGAAEVGLGE